MNKTREFPDVLPSFSVTGGIQAPQPHESAIRHVTGEALYVDDLADPRDLVHVQLGLSTEAHARVKRMDLSLVKSAPGVVRVVTAVDVPGVNDVGCMHLGDEPLFAADQVEYHGQPLFAVAADSRDLARRAVRLAQVEYEPLPAVLDIDGAREAGALVFAPMTIARGDAVAAIAKAPRRLSGRMTMGGQEHFYLESHVALAIPGADGDMTVLSSTQHPTEVQKIVASILAVPRNMIVVEVRRIGGGFGGKETQANVFAAAAALVARLTGRPAKLRPDRDDDIVITGKRHDFQVDYSVGFEEDGRILGVDFLFAARCGFSADLSGPVTDRALLHADNAYFYPAVRAQSRPLKTNTVSNTAFRGFGGPQGVLAAERVIEEVAFALGRDPLDIRLLNLYGTTDRNETPYGQALEDNIARELIEELAQKSDYRERRNAAAAHNASERFLKKGLALTPVKFGISFTATHYNQAGALVHVYTDGSVALNHGGTEMGQGIHTKVAQVVAEEFQIDLDKVHLAATSTGKVPNTSATAASAGADLNGMAAQEAARTIKKRLIAFAAEQWQVPEAEVEFGGGRVRIGNQQLDFAEVVSRAYLARVQLSATGFYRTPGIGWDRTLGKGHPFYYYCYGAAASEVTVDILTGEHKVDRVDILHDVGRSLNPAIDRGQVEGGFVQGMGWLTTEELWWDEKGRLRTHAPSTYKIPACGDRPKIFNVELAKWAENPKPTIYRSKAVGEPPLMLATSVLHAISDAIAGLGDHRICPRLDPPATPEKVLAAIERIRREVPR